MRAVRALQNATGTAENADGWWNEAKRDLVAIKTANPGKYRMVLEAIKLLGSEGPKDDKGLAQGAGESFARSVEHITRGSMSALEPFQASLAGWGVTNADDPKALAAHIRAGMDVDKDMLDLANGAIDPITRTAGLNLAFICWRVHSPTCCPYLIRLDRWQWLGASATTLITISRLQAGKARVLKLRRWRLGLFRRQLNSCRR